LPRTNYVPACSDTEYRNRLSKVPWTADSASTSTVDHYRVLVPNMVFTGGERTLQAAMIPPRVAHVHTVNSYAFESLETAVAICAAWASIPIDFFIKSTGTGHFQPNLAKRMPLLALESSSSRARTLLLNCLTTHYADL